MSCNGAYNHHVETNHISQPKSPARKNPRATLACRSRKNKGAITSQASHGQGFPGAQKIKSRPEKNISAMSRLKDVTVFTAGVGEVWLRAVKSFAGSGTRR